MHRSRGRLHSISNLSSIRDFGPQAVKIEATEGNTVAKWKNKVQRDEDLLRFQLGVDRLQATQAEVSNKQERIAELRRELRDLRERKSQADLKLIRDMKQRSSFTEQQELFLKIKEAEAKIQLETCRFHLNK